MLQQDGEYHQAIADFTEAIRINPKEASRTIPAAGAWEAKGNFAKAIADYNTAIQLVPESVLAYNSRAWIWATCPDPQHRDGKGAVDSATHACELSGWKDPDMLETLAAAYAESGDFDAAVNWEQKALEASTEETDRARCRERLALYQAKRPYRQER